MVEVPGYNTQLTRSITKWPPLGAGDIDPSLASLVTYTPNPRGLCQNKDLDLDAIADNTHERERRRLVEVVSPFSVEDQAEGAVSYCCRFILSVRPVSVSRPCLHRRGRYEGGVPDGSLCSWGSTTWVTGPWWGVVVDGVGCFWLRPQEFELGLSCRTCIARSGEWRPRAGLTLTGGAAG